MEGSPLSDLNQLAVLWRRKWIVLATIVLVVALTEIVSRSLTPIYSTTSTLIVAQPGRQGTFDLVQGDEEAARSYAQILSTRSFANQVASEVGGVSGATVASETSIQAVANTELLTVTVDDPSPVQAHRIADTYASVAVNYAPRLQAETSVTVTLASGSPIPTSPSRPKPTLYALAAAILGVMAGIGLAFLRERFDVRIRSVSDLAAHADLPILATVPVRGSNTRSVSGFAEAFRMLRTNLRFVDQLDAVRTIAVTSWTEGEGKTTTAFQLALSLATSGTHTLIIDGDAHRPSLQSLLMPGVQEPLELWLSDYILGAAPAEEIVYETRVPSLGLIPPGRPVPNFSSLLETRRGQTVFANLRDRTDALIVDCPPLAVGADAPTIAGRVDGVILVVDLRKATTTALSRAFRQLEAVNATVLGIAANRDREYGTEAYYGYKARENGAKPGRGAVLSRARRALARDRR